MLARCNEHEQLIMSPLLLTLQYSSPCCTKWRFQPAYLMASCASAGLLCTLRTAASRLCATELTTCSAARPGITVARAPRRPAKQQCAPQVQHARTDMHRHAGATAWSQSVPGLRICPTLSISSISFAHMPPSGCDCICWPVSAAATMLVGGGAWSASSAFALR